MSDRDTLSRLLAGWRHDQENTPGFEDAVWARVRDRAETPASAAIIARVFGMPAEHFRRAIPLAACAAIVISAALGSGAAWAWQRSGRAERMVQAYVRSIDPLQKSPASHRHAHP